MSLQQYIAAGLILCFLVFIIVDKPLE